MAWVAEETFDSYSDGDLHGNNGGSGWASAWNTSFAPTALDVAGTPTPFQGAKCASYTATGGTYSERQLSADVSGAFVMYVAVRAAQTNGGGARFNLRNTASSGRINIQFDAVDGGGTVGRLQILGSGGSPYTAIDLLGAPYAANTWYVIRITGNTSTGTFTAAIATAAYGSAESGAWSSESSSATMFGTGDLRYAAINMENTSADYFFDYISGTSPYTTVVEHDQDVFATATVSASMLTPKTIVRSLDATATGSASVAMIKDFVRTLEATTAITAQALKGLAMELSASTAITASTLAQRAYLVAMNAAVAVSATTQTAIGKLLEATASVSATLTKTFSVSQLLEATASITATLEAGREKVLEAAVAVSSTIQTAIGKTLTANVSIIAKVFAPFWRTKYPAHGDGDDYDVKYPHD